MPKFDLQQIKARGQASLDHFTVSQKIVLVVSALAVLVGGMLVMRSGGGSTMAPLYSNLAGEDASAITEELTSRGVSYELTDGGGTVMVPEKDVYQLRLDMSAKNLPTGGKAGYALLDKQGITTSEFRQRVDYQRAMEGELSRTIEAIDGVEASTVHLVIPEEDLFTDDASKPTASVLVKTRPGADMTSSQVRAVVHLVASSVEGMAPEDVTVADSKGRVLSAPGVDGEAATAGDTRSSQTAAYENRLATSITDMLVPVVGKDKAVVRVNAQLDFDQRSTTSERFGNADDAPAVAETTERETYTGPGQQSTGILGPDGAPLTGGGEATEYESEKEQRQLAVDKVTEQVKTAPGGVERLSVAVLVDENAPGADVGVVRDAVAAAAGLDADRGDTIEVSVLPFDTSSAEEAEKELAQQESAEAKAQMMDTARTAALVLVVAVVLFLAYRSAKKSTLVRYPVPLPVAAGPQIELPPVEAFAIGEAGGDDQTAMLPAAEPSQVEAKVSDLIDRQPDEVAQVLRNWLADRRG